MSDDTASPRRRRSGGRQARTAARLHAVAEKAPFITRTLAPFEVLSEEGLSTIEHNAETILEQVGIDFREAQDALELMRGEPDWQEGKRSLLGDWPIEIGLWVGSAASPNRLGRTGDSDRDSAVARVRRFRANGREAPAPIKACPWCGTDFTPDSFRCAPNNSAPTNLEIRCANTSCEFNRDRPLPILTVDEPIYRRLPAFLIATVDKFASMPGRMDAEGLKRWTQAAVANPGRAWRAGVAMGIGSDSGSLNDSHATVREMELFVAAGVPAAEAIKAATVNNADILGLSSRLGRLRVGYDADLIAVQGSPLEDIAKLRDVSFVMKAGKVVKEAGR